MGDPRADRFAVLAGWVVAFLCACPARNVAPDSGRDPAASDPPPIPLKGGGRGGGKARRRHPNGALGGDLGSPPASRGDGLRRRQRGWLAPRAQARRPAGPGHSRWPRRLLQRDLRRWECRCLPASAMAFGFGGSAMGTWSGKSPARGTGASRASRFHRTESASAPATGMARWLCGTTGLWKRRSASLGDSSARRGRSRSAPMASCSRPERTKGSSDSGTSPGARSAPGMSRWDPSPRSPFAPMASAIAAASAHSGDPERRGDGNVRIFDLEGHLLKRLDAYPSYSLRYASESGELVLGAAYDNRILVWDRLGKRIRTIEIPWPASHLALCDLCFARGHTDRRRKHGHPFAPSLRTGADSPSLPVPPARRGSCRRLFARSHAARRRKRERRDRPLVPTGKLVSTLDGGPGWVTALAFSPDGKLLASAGDGLRVFTRSGELVRAMPGHRPQATQVHFSPDGPARRAGAATAGSHSGTSRAAGSRTASRRSPRTGDRFSLEAISASSCSGPGTAGGCTVSRGMVRSIPCMRSLLRTTVAGSPAPPPESPRRSSCSIRSRASCSSASARPPLAQHGRSGVLAG